MTTTTAAQAVASLRSGVPPDYTYLLRNRFRVLVDRKVTTASANPVTYYAVDYEGLLRFQSGPYGKDPAKLQAFLIPTTPGSKLVAKNGSFPLNTFATIDLAHQTGFGVICNEQLTGCTVAFGWDKSTSRLYVGHAEPDDKIEAICTRAKLSDYLRKHGAFEGVKLSQSDILLVGGTRQSWSDYPDDKANVIGFITKNTDGKFTVSIIVQVEKADRTLRESWKMDFPLK